MADKGNLGMALGDRLRAAMEDEPEDVMEDVDEPEAALGLRVALASLICGRGDGSARSRMRDEALQQMTGRNLVCTPYLGAYGIAGWIICINGSPPRATVVIQGGGIVSQPDHVFAGASGELRRQRGPIWRAALRFWEVFLKDREGSDPFTLPGVDP